MQSDSASQAEVIRVHKAVVILDLLTFDTDIGNPVLTATVWAAGDVQLQILVEARQPLFQFFNQLPSLSEPE